MSPVISVLNVSKNFPGVRAFSRGRFELLAGELHALVGENGASGEILYIGEAVSFATPPPAPGRGTSEDVGSPAQPPPRARSNQNSGALTDERPKKTVQRFGVTLEAKRFYPMVGHIAPGTKIYV